MAMPYGQPDAPAQRRPHRGNVMRRFLLPLAALLTTTASVARPPAVTPPPAFEIVIHGGTIVDGSGAAPFAGDVGIKGDRIVAVAPTLPPGGRNLDAKGLVVAPGFVNMLSWANDALVEDGAGESDIRQGVTLEVMGEGNSEGPYTEKMVADTLSQQVDVKHPIS